MLENRQISKKVPSKEESHYNTIIYNITIKEFKKSNKKVMASKTIPYYYSSKNPFKKVWMKFEIFPKMLENHNLIPKNARNARALQLCSDDNFPYRKAGVLKINADSPHQSLQVHK